MHDSLCLLPVDAAQGPDGMPMPFNPYGQPMFVRAHPPASLCSRQLTPPAANMHPVPGTRVPIPAEPRLR